MNDTDKTLPVLKIELPPVPQEPERWCLTVVDVVDPGRHHLATAEEAQKFLELAGYRVIDDKSVATLRPLIEDLRHKIYDKSAKSRDEVLKNFHHLDVAEIALNTIDFLYVILGKSNP